LQPHKRPNSRDAWRHASTRFIDRLAQSRLVAIQLLLTSSIVIASCAQPMRVEPSLLPPQAAAEGGNEFTFSTEGIDFTAAFPKRDVPQRVAFLAACNISSGAIDPESANDAVALSEIYWSSKDAEAFTAAVKDRFELVGRTLDTPSTVKSKRAGLMTGYATPVVRVRSAPDEMFRFPIFGDMRMSSPELAALPRAELIRSPVARANAIAWIDDPLAWAIVETNGTARLLVEDAPSGRELLVTRIATNDRPWTSLGRALAARGLIESATYTLSDVAAAAERYPREAEAAVLENERVVFFALADNENFPPVLGLPFGKLVGGYSCAADQSIYPAGSVLVVVERPTQESADSKAKSPARILFVHDAGGAIAGSSRVDVYFGQGTEALIRAGATRVPVDVYRLELRDR
jgi:membrane-bound lytic murein transglycosylase